jgi:BTB/POZ domain
VVCYLSTLKLTHGPMMSTLYIEAMLRKLLEFQKTGHLCDTVILVDNGELKAHSAVLAAASPVFKSALCSKNGSVDHVIVLPGLTVDVAEIVLNAIYTGKTVIPATCKCGLSDKVASVLRELEVVQQWQKYHILLLCLNYCHVYVMK